jgi:hypothetical protein
MSARIITHSSLAIQPSSATEYNIFVKETLESLKITHPNLSPRERFIAMSEVWTEKLKNADQHQHQPK